MEDVRIRIIADAITKDAANALSSLVQLEQDLKRETDALNEAQKRNTNTTVGGTNQQIGIIKRLEDEIKKLKELRDESNDTTSITSYNRQLSLQEAELKKLTSTRQTDNTEVKKTESIFSSLSKTLVAVFAVDKILDYSMEVFNLTAKFEQYNTTLKNMFQSQEVATLAMDMIKTEASKTNWSVDQLTDAFIKLKGRGINMTSKDVQGISDVANYLKKDFGQVVEAINDVNNTERWNEIGIKAKTSGDKVSLTFNGVTKTVSRTEAGVMSAITQFGQLNGVMGLTADISDDLAGKKSNLGDKIDFLMVKIGKGLTPVFNFLLDLFLKGADFVSEFIDKSAPLAFAYSKIGEIFTTVFDIGKELFLTLFPSAKDKVFDLATYIKYFSTVLYSVVVPFQILKGVIVGVIDSFHVLSNASGMVWKALKGDFEGAKRDAKALESSWNSLKNNGTQNFSAISKGFNKIWSDGNGEIKKSTETFDDWVKNQKSGNANILKNSKDTNAEKAKDEKEANKKMQLEKEAFQQKITEIDNRGEEERAFEREKQMNKIYPLYTSIYAKVQSAINNLTKDSAKSGEAYSKSLTERVEKDSENIKKIIEESNAFFAAVKKEAENVAEIDRLWEQTMDETEKKMKKKQENFENIFESSFDAAAEITNQFYEYLDKRSHDDTKTAEQRQRAALDKAFLQPWKDNINAAKALMSGDFVGAAKGIGNYFKGLWDVTFNLKDMLNEIKADDFNAQWTSTMTNLTSYSEQIKENFEGLADSSIEFNEAQNAGTDSGIELEIKRAAEIRNTYTLALGKEDELYQQKLKNIESVYNQEILRITAKYDLESQLANQRLDSDSLLIKQGLNNSLLALISNEESKTSLTSEYAGRRSSIMQAFALADTDITEATSEAERTAINAAIEARTKALSELESWFTTELEFTVNSEGQKRKEYTATAQLIKDAADAQRELDITYAAESIEREKNKQIEIETANATRKANELVAETTHNNEIVRLGQEKDAALLNSFNALKEAMKAGYSEILQSANDAYTQGLITAEQYLSKLREIQDLRGLVGEGTPSLTNDIRDRLRNLGIPGFKDGTELVGGQIGVDKNLAWLSHDEAVIKGETNRKKLQAGLTNESAIQYAISYKSILDGGFSPLALKDNILPKLEERAAMQYLLNMNTQPIIDKLSQVEQTLSKLPLQKFVFDKDGVNQYEQTKNSVKVYRKKRFE
jgi:hypothetical protein